MSFESLCGRTRSITPWVHATVATYPLALIFFLLEDGDSSSWRPDPVEDPCTKEGGECDVVGRSGGDFEGSV